MKLDLLLALGEAVVTLAGPLGTPLRFLLELRKQEKASEAQSLLRNQFNERIADATIRAVGYIERYEPILGHEPDMAAQALRSIQARFEAEKTSLRRELTEFIPAKKTIEMILTDIGVPPGEIDFDGPAQAAWFDVINKFRGGGPLYTLMLLARIREEKPGLSTVNHVLGVDD